ncbi:hypothetical protein TNCT_44061 [Trichonephila clavata]|uniref:Uncharacterized protein n=1 Tax=Trichonephila clavata TaxID=2740835 RepID=A0A8X6GFV7_TRICU|nr:hypothetical protein TNCT_44061 [Trichonephila clavata]
MADDIDELLDEVESKYIDTDDRLSESQSASLSVKKSNGEELDAAIHSICSIPEPIVSYNRILYHKSNSV